MEDSQEGNFIKTVASTYVKNNNGAEFKCKKISDVKKEEQISLDEDTIFEFSCNYIKIR